MSDNLCDILLFGKTYTVLASKEEIPSLQKTAAFLDQRIHQMAKASPTNAPERLYIMTALNIAHELLSIQAEDSVTLQDVQMKISKIIEEIDHTFKK